MTQARKQPEPRESTHHKSRKTASKTNAQTTEEQGVDRESITPVPSPTP